MNVLSGLNSNYKIEVKNPAMENPEIETWHAEKH